MTGGSWGAYGGHLGHFGRSPPQVLNMSRYILKLNLINGLGFLSALIRGVYRIKPGGSYVGGGHMVRYRGQVSAGEDFTSHVSL